MDRSEIYRGMSRNRLEVATTNISDGMDGKPDTGRENIEKNTDFWWFYIKLTMLMLRYELEILIRVVWSTNTNCVKIS